jgi:hypothetical protein
MPKTLREFILVGGIAGRYFKGNGGIYFVRPEIALWEIRGNGPTITTPYISITYLSTGRQISRPLADHLSDIEVSEREATAAQKTS